MRFIGLVLASSLLVSPTGSHGLANTKTVITTTLEKRIIGTSVEGRDIEAYHRGTKGGTVVLVIGVIHGDEDAGLEIIELLKAATIPKGVDMWLVPSMNPDGVVHQTRKNSNRVDLNRNFPYNWGKIGKPDYWQYSGLSSASEPETKAMVKFVRSIKPALSIWYHQDLNIISPSTGVDGELRSRYSQITGIPQKRITGGTYTGVAATWQRNMFPGTYAFVVELGPALSSVQAAVNASAVLEISTLLVKLNK